MAPNLPSKLPLLVLLIAVTCLSQFYRVSNSVIAPELTRDLHLSASELGLAGSAFFFALFAVQIPVGMWFDRFGARRTVAALSLLAATAQILLLAGNPHGGEHLKDLLVGQILWVSTQQLVVMAALTAIASGAAFEWKPASAEVIYAGSRIDVGGGQIRGDGSVGVGIVET